MEEPLIECLIRVCTTLGLEIEPAFVLRTADGRDVEVDARLPQFGGPCGMLVVGDYATIASIAKDIPDLGYGFSTFAPHFTIDERVGSEEEMESWKDVFRDWGWSANVSERLRPEWMES